MRRGLWFAVVVPRSRRSFAVIYPVNLRLPITTGSTVTVPADWASPHVRWELGHTWVS